MHKIIYPDYSKSIANAACSVLKHFGLDAQHDGAVTLDQALAAKDYKNIIMLVYDGMGVNILQQHLAENSFLRRHMRDTLTSVYPSTTAAATTALRSGLTPFESGWTGWNVMLQELDQIVTVFPNLIKDSDEQAAPFHAAFRFLEYRSVVQRINEDTPHEAHMVFPFDDNPYRDIDDMYQRIIDLCATDQRKYIYAYYAEPDSSLHDLGVKHPTITQLMEMLNRRTEELAAQLSDTLIICIADHGHIDSRMIDLCAEYPDIAALLSRPNISGDGRAAIFWVADENKDAFEQKFNAAFADEFMLLTREEVLVKQLYGTGTMHKNFMHAMGDYLAIGIGNRYFEYKSIKAPMLSHHAGMTEQEMTVPLILISCD